MCRARCREGLSPLGQKMLQILVADRKAIAHQATLEYADAFIKPADSISRVHLLDLAIFATRREQEILKVAAKQDRLTFKRFQNNIVKED